MGNTELQAAADRWRMLGREAECGVNEIWDADAKRLADAYIAAIQPDDDDMVTGEWLLSLGSRTRPHARDPEVRFYSLGYVVDILHDKNGWRHYPSAVPLPTRGHVRRLCAALSVVLEDVK